MEEKVQGLLTRIKESVPEELGVLIPVSGGSDSALCFWLYSQALPERTRGIYFGKNIRSFAWFDSIGSLELREPSIEMSDAEIARWASLLEIALEEKRVLVGARNRTEDVLGTFSHASRIAFHLPIKHLWKSEVMALCEYVSVPEEILASSRMADPVCGRPEELAQIPFASADAFLAQLIGAEPITAPELDMEQQTYLGNLYERNRYKRELPLSFSD